MDDALSLSGKLLADTLKRADCQVVFAESCTAGLASATLAENPGVSAHHCGSAVTYQNATKQAWLGVPADLLNPPGPGAVSEPVARAMAQGVLERTANAGWSAAITGHLGPDAEPGMDGLVWLAVARRVAGEPPHVIAVEHRLPATASGARTIREERQRTAARLLLELLNQQICETLAPAANTVA